MSSQPQWTPREITPAQAEVAPTGSGLVTYLSGRTDLTATLTDARALVFRGFGLTPAEFEQVIDLLLPGRLAYVHGNSPRTKVGDNVYTSTEYPPEYTISMHNELSYAAQWPARLLFYCQQAPRSGGATPVVDGTRWLAALRDEVRTAFAKGVRYQQNLHGGAGLGKSWQATFETDSKDEVEAFLDEAGADWEWRAGDALRVRQHRPATINHPVTGAEVWFNQADQWHVAGLGDETAAALATIMPEDELPQSVTFADGSPIPAEYVEHVRDCGLSSAVDVDWHQGDLLLIDNVAVGHGRRPFTGPRRVLVAMSG